jgi:hypothetical protein
LLQAAELGYPPDTTDETAAYWRSCVAAVEFFCRRSAGAGNRARLVFIKQDAPSDISKSSNRTRRDTFV